MTTEINNNYTGIGLFGGLGLLFIALKLMGVIDWPWWAVLAPLWGPFALVVVIGLVLLAIVVLSDHV